MFSQKTIYVNKSATGLGDGTTWTNAFNDITSAISDSDYGDQIWVAAAIYQECIVLKNGVALCVGFVSDETLLEQRDYTSNQTTIDADYNGSRRYHYEYGGPRYTR